ncbi:hypothetical protein NFI95_11950 [Acetobacteraceae bacterium KSS8]|uniref:YfhO family protein n=1 Tax=Endosaccharibacter trunci TaxID=2812733 RepID=A0ABT1W8D8_9PROT|nr:hypothetical protein [Acetobacteraceae bacterium KSS8]
MPASSRLLRMLLVLAGAVFSVAVFLRVQIETGFSLVTGDIYDGRIEVSLLQHWFNVIRGLEHWSRTAYFYPLSDTLGCNDGYLLYGLVFSAFRFAGVEPMLASDLVNVVVRLAGYAGFIAMATELFGLSLLWATLGAVLFSVSNGMMLQAAHQQLLSVGFAPILAWMLGRGWRALPTEPIRAAVWGSASGLFYGAWLLTAFYTAWFSTFFVVLWGAILLVSTGRFGEGRRRRVLRRLLCWPVAVTAVITLLSLVPFLHVYLPAAAATGQHSFTEAFAGLPDPGDWLRLGSRNRLFGWLEALLDSGMKQPASGESLVGFTPLLWIAAAVGAVSCWSTVGPTRLPLVSDSGQDGAPRPVWQAMSLALLVSLLLSMKLFDVTAWKLVYRFVPGAAAIRQETRFLLILDLPMVLLALLALRWMATCWPRPVAAAAALLLVMAELNQQGAQALDRPVERRVTERVPPAPAACRSFVVVTRGTQPQAGSPEVDALYHHTVDAMMLAEERAFPTLNGYATFVPPEIAKLNRLPVLPGVLRDYADTHGIEAGLCQLDMDQNRWVVGLTPPPVMPENGFRFAGADTNVKPYLDAGWSWAETDGRWTVGPEAALDMTLPDQDRGRPLHLDLEALPFFPPHAAASPVTVTANGRQIARWLPQPGQQHFTAEIAAGDPAASVLRLRFRIEHPMSPRSVDGTADDRQLGMRFRLLRIVPANSPSD